MFWLVRNLLSLNLLKVTLFAEALSGIFNALMRTSRPIPDIICSVCEKHIERFNGQPSEPNSLGRIPRSDVVSTLILRLYEQTKSDQIKRQCLDLIDRLMEKNPYDLTRNLSEREK